MEGVITMKYKEARQWGLRCPACKAGFVNRLHKRCMYCRTALYVKSEPLFDRDGYWWNPSPNGGWTPVKEMVSKEDWAFWEKSGLREDFRAQQITQLRKQLDKGKPTLVAFCIEDLKERMPELYTGEVIA